MRIAVEGVRLPGLRFERFDGVQVGLRVGGDVVELVPGHADAARWEIDVRVRDLGEDGYDFTGPAVSGRRGDRSVKLAWLDGRGELFRAAKVRLDRIPAEVVAEGLTTEGGLVATVALTDERGGPTCASVPASLISWSVASAPS